MTDDMKQLVETEAAEAENHRDEPTRGERRGRTRSTVYSIRLTPEQVEEIQRIADDAGIPPSGLVRGWVLQALADEQGPVESTLESLTRDVERLKRQLAAS